MDDSSTPPSNQANMDSFPLFKNFTEPKDTQDPFTIDKSDIEEIQSSTAAIPIETPQTSKQNNVIVIGTKKPSLCHAAQCDICSVLFSGEKDYVSHIKGKKHQAKLATVLTKDPQYKAPTYQELCSKNQESIGMFNQSGEPETSLSEIEKASLLPSANSLICHVCNVMCNSQRMFDDHINGKKHQIKLKLHNLNNSTPSRLVPDNNPSSSNYCDVCSVQLSSENKLTEHLAQKRHQLRAKEDEFCAREAAIMNINFDDYQISTMDAKKNWFTYQCTACNKKFGNKVKLVEHLKSALHAQLTNQSKTRRLPQNINRGNQQGTRNRLATSSQKFSSPRDSRKPFQRSRPPYRSQGFSWNQRSQSFDRNFNQQTSSNPFGAFDPNNNYNYPAKRSTQSIDISNEYSGFYPKRICTHTNEGDSLRDSYSTYGNYIPPSTSSTFSKYPSNSQTYSSQVTNYNNQSSESQSSMQYSTDSYYNEQQNPQSLSVFTNPISYSSEQSPFPNYDQASSSSSHDYHLDYSTFTDNTTNPGNTSYTQQPYHY